MNNNRGERIHVGEATNKCTALDKDIVGQGKMAGPSLRRIAFVVLAFVPIEGDFIKETAVTEDIVEQVLCAGWVARRAYATDQDGFAPIDSYVMQLRSR